MSDENQASEDAIFLEAKHETSGRLAVLEDDGNSGWLYLTEPNTRRPVADAWVYNRIPAPTVSEVKAHRGGPPPAAIGYASDSALCESPREHEWTIIWTADGHSVAIAKDGVPAACIVANQNPGFSRELIKDGPWGRVWSDAEFARVF